MDISQSLINTSTFSYGIEYPMITTSSYNFFDPGGGLNMAWLGSLGWTDPLTGTYSTSYSSNTLVVTPFIGTGSGTSSTSNYVSDPSLYESMSYSSASVQYTLAMVSVEPPPSDIPVPASSGLLSLGAALLFTVVFFQNKRLTGQKVRGGKNGS
jgi:hypothetical protein